ncbi:MAG: UDP-N-acetylglucosamine--N-acetylmuramyl-(pentapeptide) pyrophosphoryl-undecaprenol N-acetylglucosamine transferase [Brevinema sp.]
MKILLSGGGTGGHLIPGIALYKEFTQHGHQALYVLREDDLSYNAVSHIAKEDRLQVNLGRVSRKLTLKTPMQVMDIFRAWMKAFNVIKKFKPDAVIVTGGYVSNIAALSAFFLRVPLYLLEQNSVAGVTNRFWARYAKSIFTFFPEVKKVSNKKIMAVGNPLLYTAKVPQKEGKDFFGFSDDKTVLGISGGSQGAKILNDLIFNLLPKLKEYSLIWSLGTREYSRFENEGYLEKLKSYPNVNVQRFIDRMDCFWGAADGVIARAGAGTVSESLFFAKPTLFIPIHGSPDNHQYLNADFLRKKGLGLLIEEPELSAESLLETIKTLLNRSPEMKLRFTNEKNNPAQAIRHVLEENSKNN